MKAQISMEFMSYIAILLVVMTFASFFAIRTTIDLRTETINSDAKRLAELTATEINTAVEVGDGYTRTFFLPQYLHGGTNYTVEVLFQRAYVFWGGRAYSLPVLAKNITGVLIKGYNTIRNSKGVITLG